MKFIRPAFLTLWVASSLCLAIAAPAERSQSIPTVLRQLAARASTPHGQIRLRQWAAAVKNPQHRSLAYFVVGYQEYADGDYLSAAEDLRQAAAEPFQLSDFAEYYWASAASRLAEAQYAGVIEALDGFSERHPQSVFRLDALALLVPAQLQGGDPERALAALLAEPRVRQLPSLAILLAQAYRQAQKPVEAARAYQEVYYLHAASPEAKTAEAPLEELRAQLGASFPIPAEELLRARPDAFFNRSRLAEAEKEYNALLQANPASSFAGHWRVQRGRCLARLRRTSEALDLLSAAEPANPTVDSERLAALVDTHLRLDDLASAVQALEQLRSLYPQSDACAEALARLGGFLVYQGDWQAAQPYYLPLAEQFPESNSGREGHWRLAWSYHLQRLDEPARRCFIEHISRYPDSPHRAAALYWLGRTEEDRGAYPTAARLYQTLTSGFPHTYYTLQAKARQRSDPRLRAAAATGAIEPDVASALAEKPSPKTPLLQPCRPVPPDDLLQPMATLEALSLSELAINYLKKAVKQRPDSLALRLAASRLEAAAGHAHVALFHAKQLAPDAAEYEFSALPQEVWNLLYPKPFWNVVKRQARVNGLDPYVVMGLIRQESAFNAGAVSPANARGLMQLLPSTAARQARRKRGVGSRIYDPAYNIRLGCGYLAGVLKTFDGNIEQALAAYNAGNSRVQEWLSQRQFSEPAEFAETIPIRETRVYVQTVLRNAEVYRQLLTGKARFASCGAGRQHRGTAARQPHVPR